MLAAGLMRVLVDEIPAVRFEGVAGPRMAAVGIDAWAPMDSLSVMGLFEVLRHLPRLLRLRGRLLERWRDTPPALFIGVDAPDFNLPVERRLRAAGIPTVHYVSPTVWAWRTGRVRKIRRAVDLLLVILPFEKAFLERHGVAAHYVGHPLASEIPLQPDRAAGRAAWQLDPERPTLAVLPGSRRGEVSRLAGPFLEAAARVNRARPEMQFVAPLVNDATRQVFEEARRQHAPDLPIAIGIGNTQGALAAADVVLVASGTATLETLLSKRPMVVGYRVSQATYRLVTWLRLIKTPYVALSNLLAGEELAPELIQDACRPEPLADAVLALFDDASRRDAIAARYRAIHEQLRMDSNREAALAVVRLLRDRGLV
jgi:lipid-A-disaccharide synthase